VRRGTRSHRLYGEELSLAVEMFHRVGAVACTPLPGTVRASHRAELHRDLDLVAYPLDPAPGYRRAARMRTLGEARSPLRVWRDGDPPTPSDVPAIAATDLPIAPSIKPAPRPVVTVKPTLATRAPPPTATTPKKPNCDPPYDLDASRNKIWKPECLY
jgi:hypothetical protein